MAKNRRANLNNVMNSADDSGRNKKKNSKKVWRRIRVSAFILLFSIVFFVVSGISAATLIVKYRFFDRYLGNINRGDGSFDDSNIVVHKGLSEEVKNIAVFGVDSRSDDNAGSRSDAMMIVSFDMKHKKVKAISLMRDSLVEIPDYGKKKINSAFSLGGVELAINTINHNFDMNITDYVVINFNQMASIVDTLGGVEVDISEAERRNANKYIKEMADEIGEKPNLIKESGPVTLYGYQAVAYARIRAVGNSDFQRTERQREVMEKLMNKALAVGASKYFELVNALSPMIETSLSDAEIMEFVWYIGNNGKPKFEQGRFPIDGTYTTNQYYAMIYDMEEAAEKLHSFIYDDVPFYDEVETED